MDEIEELIEALDFSIEQSLTDIELEYESDCSELRIIFPSGKVLVIYESQIQEYDDEEDDEEDDD